MNICLYRVQIIFIQNYLVTEKADGARYLLYIYNSNGYLINSKQEVIQLGLSVPDVKGDWLLDGEYITKNKRGEDINLYT